jgi:hypothetical protein
VQSRQGERLVLMRDDTDALAPLGAVSAYLRDLEPAQ